MIILKMAELYTARTAKNYDTYICVVSPTTSTCRGRRTSTGAAVVVYEGSAESEAVSAPTAHTRCDLVRWNQTAEELTAAAEFNLMESEGVVHCSRGARKKRVFRCSFNLLLGCTLRMNVGKNESFSMHSSKHIWICE